MDLIWNTPVAATDAWVGRLDGSLIAGDSSCVTHLMVRRGLLVRTRYAVPIFSLARADSDGLFLDLPLAKVRGMPRPEETGASGASYTPGTRVVAADGAVLRLKGIRASEDTTVTHLVIGRPGRVCPIGEVTLGEGQSLSLPLSRGDVARLPAYRPDDAIEADLWEALYEAEGISDIDLKGVRADVDRGVVSLRGNVRTRSGVADTETVAHGVGGVSEVRNSLLSDWDLDMRVASFLAAREPDLASEIAVHTHLGTVMLEGFLPNGVDRKPILDAVASLEGVQGVDDHLEVRPSLPSAPEETGQQRDQTTGEAAQSAS